jgi:uncharacterized protein YigA (DUF484 family)
MPQPSAEAVAAFLRENPDFLARNPDLYRVLTPPRRVHGEGLADHMAAMLAAERSRIRALESEVNAVVANGRAGTGLILRVRLAVLALMRARDIPEVVTQELPALLGMESCTLAAEPAANRLVPVRRGGPRVWAEQSPVSVPHAGVLQLPRGTVRQLISPGRDAVVRTSPTDLELLHAEAAPLITRDALVRVPVWCGTPVLLAIGAREPSTLPVRQATATLAFLGRAIAAALSR